MHESFYKINVSIFEGPLDLLLHLIRKNDLDIYHVPIAPILDEYLSYLDLMKELDIDLAGDFILMAAELAHIKARMILDQEGDEEEEGPDPRADLIARLLEYQKFKNASRWLLERPLLNRDIFRRQDSSDLEESSKEEAKNSPTIPIGLEVDPVHLLRSLHEVLKKAPKEVSVEMQGERVSISDRIYQVWDLLTGSEGGEIPFEKLFDGGGGRGDIVMTFLAVLEMARLRMIRIYQESLGGAIRVLKVMTDTKELPDLQTTGEFLQEAKDN